MNTSTHDSTTHQQAELVRSLNAAIIGIGLDRRIQTWNSGAEKLFGFQFHEAIGEEIGLIVPESRVVEAGACCGRAMIGESFYVETQRRQKSGQLVEVAMWLSPIRSEEGTITGACAVIQDINARKTADRALRREADAYRNVGAALRASERDFRTFFEIVGVGNVIADARSGRFLRVNRSFCEITGYTETELYGMTSYMITHADDVERDRAGWERALREGEGTFTIEKRYRRKDGATRWVQVTSSLVRDPHGEPLHAIAVVCDATERKFLEWAFLESGERESRRIGQELHDHLCQYLLGAAFSAKALARNFSPNSAAAADMNDLARLINSSVQQAREIAQGQNPSILDAEGLVVALQALADSPRTGVKCRFECPKAVEIDPQAALHVFRIAQEAVSNAARHSGGQEVVIRWREDGDEIFLQVQNDGTGFMPENFTDDGIGLAAMKYRAHALGGHLRFDTPVGGGSCVTCSLPKK